MPGHLLGISTKSVNMAGGMVNKTNGLQINIKCITCHFFSVTTQGPFFWIIV